MSKCHPNCYKNKNKHKKRRKKQVFSPVDIIYIYIFWKDYRSRVCFSFVFEVTPTDFMQLCTSVDNLALYVSMEEMNRC